MIVVLFPISLFLLLLALFGALAALGGIYMMSRSSRRGKVLTTHSPDGRFIATATSGTVAVRDCARHGLYSHFRTGYSLRTLLWSPDSACLATVSDDGVVCVWNTWTGRLLFPALVLSAPGASVAWSPSSRHLAIVGFDQSIQVWDVVTWERIYTSLPAFAASRTLLDFLRYRVEAVVWSPTGRYLAIAESEGSLRVWDGETLNVCAWQDEHGRKVQALAFSEDGSFLLLGDETGRVSVLHVPNGQREFWSYQHGHPISAVYWGRGDYSGDVYVQDTDGSWLHWKRLEVFGPWLCACGSASSAKIA